MGGSAGEAVGPSVVGLSLLESVCVRACTCVCTCMFMRVSLGKKEREKESEDRG